MTSSLLVDCRRVWRKAAPTPGRSPSTGVLAVIGIAFLIAEAALEYIGALVLLLVGGAILLGVLRRKPEAEGTAMPEAEPMVEESGPEEENLE